MILVMLLLVLTIIQGTGRDLYLILLFEEMVGGRFVPPLNKRMTQIAVSTRGYIRIARQCRFLVSSVIAWCETALELALVLARVGCAPSPKSATDIETLLVSVCTLYLENLYFVFYYKIRCVFFFFRISGDCTDLWWIFTLEGAMS